MFLTIKDIENSCLSVLCSFCELNQIMVKQQYYMNQYFGSKKEQKKGRMRDTLRIKSECDLDTCSDTIQSHPNVKFSQCLIDSSTSSLKHKKTSILKRNIHSLSKNNRVRSESVNSMAGQTHIIDQKCLNADTKKTMRVQYERIKENCGRNSKYIDTTFPPVSSSFFTSKLNKHNKKKNMITWMRISELYYSCDVRIFGENPQKNRIYPTSKETGRYFVDGMNVVKNCKEYFKKTFEDQMFNQQGVYYVKVFKENVQKYVFIDDFIPVVEIGQAKKTYERYLPAFITSQIKVLSMNKAEYVQIWPFLLEKALAKVYGSYQALQRGNIQDFLQELINQPSKYYPLTQNHLNLSSILQNNLQTVAFTKNNNKQKTALICSVGNSSKIAFIKNEKQKVIIEPEQLPKYFKHLYVFGGTNFSYVGQCPIKQFRQSISLRTFQLKTASFISLTLCQKDLRYFPPVIGYQYSWIRFILLQKDIIEGYRWIKGKYENSKYITIEEELSVGEYLILVMPEWKIKPYDLNLILRGQFPIQLQRKPYKQGIFEEGCTDLAQRFGALNQWNQSICSYSCIHNQMAIIVQNINNQRLKGSIRIIRQLEPLKSKHPISFFNKEFENQKVIELQIKHSGSYTIVLMMKGGIDNQFFSNFQFSK